MEAINFTEHPWIVAGVAFVSWPVYRMLAKIFYGENYEKLAETMTYLRQWDWDSAMKGRYWDDYDATMKFKVYIAICIVWVCAVSELLCRI